MLVGRRAVSPGRCRSRGEQLRFGAARQCDVLLELFRVPDHSRRFHVETRAAFLRSIPDCGTKRGRSLAHATTGGGNQALRACVQLLEPLQTLAPLPRSSRPSKVVEHKKCEAPRDRNRRRGLSLGRAGPTRTACLPAVAAAATTATALAAILCFVDVEDPSVELCAVHGCNRGSAYCSIDEGDETKPA